MECRRVRIWFLMVVVWRCRRRRLAGRRGASLILLLSSSSPSSSVLQKSHHLLPKSHLFQPPNQLFLAGTNYLVPKMASRVGGFSVRSQSETVGDGYRTLIEHVGKGGLDVGDDLVLLVDHIQYACKKIAAIVASPFNSSLSKQQQSDLAGGGSGRDKPKPLDLVSVE